MLVGATGVARPAMDRQLDKSTMLNRQPDKSATVNRQLDNAATVNRQPDKPTTANRQPDRPATTNRQPNRETLPRDTLPQDSVAVDTSISKDAITDPVFSTGEDSTIYILEEGNRRVLIYGNAKVNYQDMEITADFINFDLENKIAYARGTFDSVSNTTK